MLDLVATLASIVTDFYQFWEVLLLNQLVGWYRITSGWNLHNQSLYYLCTPFFFFIFAGYLSRRLVCFPFCLYCCLTVSSFIYLIKSNSADMHVLHRLLILLMRETKNEKKVKLIYYPAFLKKRITKLYTVYRVFIFSNLRYLYFYDRPLTSLGCLPSIIGMLICYMTEIKTTSYDVGYLRKT